MSKLHKIKLLSDYFPFVESGVKNAEVRFNDRDYQSGDIIELHEWNKEEYSGRKIVRRITGVFSLDGIGLGGWVLICMERLEAD